MNLNIVQVCGRLTKDVETRTLANGNTVSSFSVATNRRYKDKDDQKVEEVEYHNITAWGKTGEVIAKWFAKGDEIYIQGRLKTSNWEVEGGGKKYRTDIVAEKFEFGQKSKANAERSAGGTQPAEPEAQEEIKVEDIPF